MTAAPRHVERLPRAMTGSPWSRASLRCSILRLEGKPGWVSESGRFRAHGQPRAFRPLLAILSPPLYPYLISNLNIPRKRGVGCRLAPRILSSLGGKRSGEASLRVQPGTVIFSIKRSRILFRSISPRRQGDPMKILKSDREQVGHRRGPEGRSNVNPTRPERYLKSYRYRGVKHVPGISPTNY